MVIAISLLVALVGVLVYAFTANPKVSTIGLIAYGAGLLAFLLNMPGHPLNLLHQ